MNNFISCCGLVLILCFSISGCKDNSTEPSRLATAEPVVKKTSVNYSPETLRNSFPDTVSLENISKAYTKDYSEELKTELFGNMQNEVAKLGEDSTIFDNILLRIGCKTANSYLLPTYAEKAKYEGQDVWIIQLTYGLDGPVFEHYKCFVVGIKDLNVLDSICCK